MMWAIILQNLTSLSPAGLSSVLDPDLFKDGGGAGLWDPCLVGRGGGGDSLEGFKLEKRSVSAAIMV